MRHRLFAWGLWLGLTGVVSADPVPLTELTLPQVRSHLSKFWATEAAVKRLDEIKPFITLTPETLGYAEGKLTWTYKAAQPLTEPQKQQANEIARGLLTQGFGNFDGGLLNEADLGVVITTLTLQPEVVVTTPPVVTMPPVVTTPPVVTMPPVVTTPPVVTMPPVVNVPQVVNVQPAQEPPYPDGGVPPTIQYTVPSYLCESSIATMPVVSSPVESSLVVSSPLVSSYVVSSNVVTYRGGFGCCRKSHGTILLPCFATSLNYTIVSPTTCYVPPQSVAISSASIAPTLYSNSGTIIGMTLSASPVTIAPTLYSNGSTNGMPIRATARAPRAMDADVPALLGDAQHRVRANDLAGAAEAIDLALRIDSRDARLWYWKATIEMQQGNRTAAEESARQGQACAMAGNTSEATLAMALEQVQGPTRRFLREVSGPETMSEAKQLAARPYPARETGTGLARNR